MVSKTNTQDEEYKGAVSEVIDDRMRVDVLGPRFCMILKEHKPATTVLHDIIKESLREPLVRNELHTVIDDYDKGRKIVWVNRILGAAGTIILALLIWGVEYLLTH